MPQSSPVHPELLLGAHMSVSGGLHRAVERIASVQGTALQVFTRNQRQWKAAPISDAERHDWFAALSEWGSYPIASHASYLLNLANPDQEKAARSIQGLIDELERCAVLRIPLLVMHPGSHLGAGEAPGLRTFTCNLDAALDRSGPGNSPMVLLETTSGQGTNLGADFAHFSEILSGSNHADRLGICLDTCHVFAAGYDLRTPEALAATLAELDRAVGLDRLRLLHLNDSKHALGSRKDRHENIGEGLIGRAGFEALMREPLLRGLPMVLETPKEDDLADDVRNLQLLRSLVP
ncbi:MAG: deoxyribonuclease IV [Desulfovibrionaceae bacterium]